MPENIWHPWKVATIGLLLVGTTALVTTLVMGYRSNQQEPQMPWATMHSSVSVGEAAMPIQIDVDACNVYAQKRAGEASGAEYRAVHRSCMRQKGH